MNFGITSCFRCNGTDIITDYSEGDVICRSCGEIVGTRIIDEAIDWRQVSKNEAYDCEDYARCSTMKVDDFAATTLVGNSTMLNRSLKCAVKSVSYTKEDIAIITPVRSIYDYCTKLKIGSKIVEKACDLFKQAIAKGLCCARTKDALVACVIYASCRIEGFQRTLQEVSNLTGVSKASIGKLLQTLTAVLNLEKQLGRILPNNLVERMISQLHLSFKIANYSKSCCQLIEQLDLFPGTHPQTVAAGAILFIYGTILLPKMVPKAFLLSLADVAALPPPGAALFKVHSMLLKHKNEVLPNELRSNDVHAPEFSNSSGVSVISNGSTDTCEINTNGTPTVSTDSCSRDSPKDVIDIHSVVDVLNVDGLNTLKRSFCSTNTVSNEHSSSLTTKKLCV